MQAKPQSQSYDVLVAGAGPAGLVTACLLAQHGISVMCVGPIAGAGDTRTTALFGGALRLLDLLGLTRTLQDKGADLCAMRIIDRLERPEHPSSLSFPASEIGLDRFGTNYRNVDLLSALEACALKLPSLTRSQDMITDYEHSQSHVIAKLKSGDSAEAQLIVAADGRNSAAREAAKISAKIWNYGQTAIAFQVSHSRSHKNVSTEIHHHGGPLTFIPLPGTSSAINWLLPPDDAVALMGASDEVFLNKLKQASGGALGHFSNLSPRAAFPISGLSVDSLAKNRTVLVGEAAHVLPPIGAQGLNLGFRDAATFTELVIAAKSASSGIASDVGSDQLLANYAAARKTDILTRRAATDLLNRSLLFGSGAVAQLRGLGLVFLASSQTARAKLMSQGMVQEADLPQLMRKTA